jgi:hypothetical protein
VSYWLPFGLTARAETLFQPVHVNFAHCGEPVSPEARKKGAIGPGQLITYRETFHRAAMKRR